MTLTADRVASHVSSEAFLDDLAEVVEEVRAGATTRDRERRYAREEIEMLRTIGFWKLQVPAEYGGLGLDQQTVVAATMLLAGADGSLGQIPQNHFMTAERLRLSPPGAQRDHWLRVLGDGAVLGNAQAEPGERHPGSVATALQGGPGAWRLTGRKVYCTGALLADHVAVQLRGPDGEQRTALVRGDDTGVLIRDDWQSIGQRTTASGTSEYDEVPVADVAVLEHTTDPVATYRVSSLGQLVHAAIDAGIAEGALAEAVALAKRVHGGRGSGAREFRDDVLGIARLGELRLAALTARRLVEAAAARLAALHERSPLDLVADVFYEVAAAKVASTRAALEVTSGLFEIGGSSSTRPELGLDRFWRDARTHTLHDAVRQKPYALGRWLVQGDLADPWSVAHPFRDIDELADARDDGSGA